MTILDQTKYEEVLKKLKTRHVSASFLSALEAPHEVLYSYMMGIKTTTPSMKIGSYVDCALTTPELLEQKFKVVEIPAISGLMEKFISACPKGLSMLNKDDEELFTEAYNISGFKISLKRVLEQLFYNENNWAYYKNVVDVEEDVTILTQTEYQKAQWAIDTILNSNFPDFQIFKLIKERGSNSSIEVRTQVELDFEYFDEQFKGAIDLLVIEHDSKTIKVIDLKVTSKPIFAFKNSIIDYRYHRQLSIYQLGIVHNEYIQGLLKEGYILLTPEILVVEVKPTPTNLHACIKFLDNDIKAGIEGGYYKGTYIKGVDDLLEDFKFYKEYGFDTPRSLVEEKGRINIQLF